MRWDIFCRVIDNHGDLGVCWRLARELAARGHRVRLWVDDARALAWMAPQGADGVQVLGWAESAPADVGDVVVEAFGCDPPAAFVQAMAQRAPAPVWINLEYLSAEAYVERSHGLPSPTACGLRKWFFYPGFTSRTGGLLHEPGLLREQAAFDGTAWRAARGWASQPGERVLSLFCYALPPPAGWLPALADRPTLLLATPGPAVAGLRTLALPSHVRVIELPWLSQPDYDRLLWSCALNGVRGEDSFVRALWSPAPLLWQIYPQHDGVHAAKLEAFLDLYLHGAPDALALGVRLAHRHWNGLASAVAPGPVVWPDLAAWTDWHRSQRRQWLGQDDLVTQLCRFVAGKHVPAC
jgi:uncharacterized repeat protein (TIGR03837 family)